MKGVIFPEIISGRKDGALPGEWTVTEGGVLRGTAWCNVSERKIHVPVASSETARVVRAHELMHARVSPLPEMVDLSLSIASMNALKNAEELRVNTLIQRLGFDTNQLVDGTEAPSFAKMAQLGLFSEVVESLPIVINTGAEKPTLAAIRKHQPEWMPVIRETVKGIKKIVTNMEVERLGGTEPELFSSIMGPEATLPVGYHTTVRVALLIDRASSIASPATTDARQMKNVLSGSRRIQTNQYAEMVIAPFDGVPSARRTSQSTIRATSSGSAVRYPQRLLTDPQMRAFARRSPATGGIVVLDISGSMELNMEDVSGLVARFPRAKILAYSHRPGDKTGSPNAWVLAKDGMTARELPVGNMGNGVDGPALVWATKHRETPSERIVWVSDGRVTDSNDHSSEQLRKENIAFVKRHRIQRVESIQQVELALNGKLPNKTERPPVYRTASLEPIEFLGSHNGTPPNGVLTMEM